MFKAEVFDVVRGGLRVSLLDNGAMVFVPCALISASKEAMDCSTATGEFLVNGKAALRLGDFIEVRIVDVNKTTRSIVAAPVNPIGGLILPDPKTVKAAR